MNEPYDQEIEDLKAAFTLVRSAVKRLQESGKLPLTKDHIGEWNKLPKDERGPLPQVFQTHDMPILEGSLHLHVEHALCTQTITFHFDG